MDETVFSEQKCEDVNFKIDKFYDTPDCSKKFVSLAKKRDEFLLLTYEKIGYDKYPHGLAEELIAKADQKLSRLEKSLKYKPEEPEYEDYYLTSFMRLDNNEQVFASKNPIFVSEFDSVEEVISMNYPHLNIDFGDAKYFIRKTYDHNSMYNRNRGRCEEETTDAKRKARRLDLFKIPYFNQINKENLQEVSAIAQKYGKVIINTFNYGSVYSHYNADGSVHYSGVCDEPMIARPLEGGQHILFYSPDNHELSMAAIKEAEEKRNQRNNLKKAKQTYTVSVTGIKFWIESLISGYLKTLGMASKVDVLYEARPPYNRSKEEMKKYIANLLNQLEKVCKNINNPTIKTIIKDPHFEWKLNEKCIAGFSSTGTSTLKAIDKDMDAILGDRKNCIRVFKSLCKAIKEPEKK